MNFLLAEWSQPLKTFGTVHIISIVLLFGAIILGCIFGKKMRRSAKTDTIVTAIGLTLLALELLKTIFNLKVDGTYDIANIPFQLCSVPLFLLPWIKWMKKGHIKNAFLGFCGFFSLCAGVFYFVKPTRLLTAQYIFISVHSALWHILLAFVGFFILFAYEESQKISTFCKGSIVLAAAIVIAVAVNTLCDALCPEVGVNLFWISPKEPTFYPIISLIFKDPKPYPLFLVCYFVYLCIGASLFFGIGQLENLGKSFPFHKKH